MGKIMHGDQVYSGGSGSVVQANPSDTASANLEKVKIDGTTYAIPSGGGGSVDDVQVDNVSVVDQNGVAHIDTMAGAGASSAGTKGLVPAPASGDNEKFLAGDGTWKTPQSGSQTLDGLTDVELTSPSVGQALLFDGTEWVNGTPSGGASSIATLTDVDLNNLSNGQVLKWNDTTQKWENADESGGGGGSGEGIVIIPITGGTNTSSRTFSFDKTPKHISVTYDSADSSPWCGHWEFTWGDQYAFGMCNPKSVGQGCTIVRAGLTYGADNKSFTVTGWNAFQAWNQSGSVRGGFMLVDYGGGGGSSTLAGLSDVDLETTTPTDGQILVYDETNQKWVNADENVEVVANPNETATATLSKLKVGTTVYEVPQGGGTSNEFVSGVMAEPVSNTITEEVGYEFS